MKFILTQLFNAFFDFRFAHWYVPQNMTCFLIIGVIMANSNTLCAQDPGKIYLKNSSLISGKIYFDKNNPASVGLRENLEAIRTLLAAEVDYFLMDKSGDIFVSRMTDDGSKFMSLAVNGETRLYEVEWNGLQYFVESDLIPFSHLKRDNYQIILAEANPGCTLWSAVVKKLGYSRNSLSHAIEMINAGECAFAPAFEVGISAGALRSQAHLNVGRFRESIGLNNNKVISSFFNTVPESVVLSGNAWSVGIFTEHPIPSTRRVVLETSMSYAHLILNEELIHPGINQDYQIRAHTVDVSGGVSFILRNRNRTRLAANAGLLANFSLDNKLDAFQSQFFDDTVIFNRYDESQFLRDQVVGLYTGIHFRNYYSDARFIQFEIGVKFLNSPLSDNKVEFTNYTFTLKHNIL